MCFVLDLCIDSFCRFDFRKIYKRRVFKCAFAYDTVWSPCVAGRLLKSSYKCPCLLKWPMCTGAGKS